MFAIVVAASELLFVQTVRADSVSVCGCAAGSSCSSPKPPGEKTEEVASSGSSPSPREHSGGSADLSRHAISLPMDGVAVKISYYRGLGGGVTGSFTRDAVTLTVEGGAGVGGSFSVGSLAGRPESGLSFEARASTSGGVSFVRFPDFGLTVSDDGLLQGYLDAKTDHFRTRFRTRPYSLADGAVEGPAEAPVTRRSWSLGTEFKVAAAYTVRVPLRGFLDLVAWILGAEQGGRDFRSPPSTPADRAGGPMVLGRAMFRRSPVVRPRRARHRLAAVDRHSGSWVFRVLRLVRAVRSVRSARPRAPGSPGTASTGTPRTGSRDRGARAVPDGGRSAV
ncbi:MAG TPA: hypothetical protein VIL71_16565 [Spirillospora sp.]